MKYFSISIDFVHTVPHITEPVLSNRSACPVIGETKEEAEATFLAQCKANEGAQWVGNELINSFEVQWIAESQSWEEF